MPKLVLEISELAVLNMLIQILLAMQELAYYTQEANCIWMLKMMLPATQTSCLKYSHTNLRRYIGISTLYFGNSLSLYIKKMTLPATINSCLKYSHTNSSIYVRTGIGYFEQLNNLYPKTNAGNIRTIAASSSLVARTR